MAPVVLAMREAADRFEATVVSTGQHQAMLDRALGDFGITPVACPDELVHLLS
ncbi:MAG: hypothetical protein HOI34_02305 [Rhodospirillaceae bacterium]|nr:hypothetical protein [Rhodospirillaceae bacterium]MBT6202515.1 hypothetical protein [Rhodospirillaceae bacterium]MBT6510476.1 hypothetical protein [Rhodospirillaceae bacterium]